MGRLSRLRKKVEGVEVKSIERGLRKKVLREG
jgi:hypothetical protein